MALTLHVDASDTDTVFTTYDAGGAHSGVPFDGNAVQVWDDEGDGIADVALIYTSFGGSTEPDFRSGGSALMADSCIDFNGSSDVLLTYDQDGGALLAASNFLAVNAKTVIIAFYAEAITTTGTAAYQNHCLVGDAGGNWGIFLKNNGGTLQLIHYNFDSGEDVVPVTVTTGASHVLQARHDGTSIYISLDGAAEQSQPSGNTADLSTALRFGASPGPAFTNASTPVAWYNGRIGEAHLFDSNEGFPNATYTAAQAKWLPSAAVPPKKNIVRSRAAYRAAHYKWEPSAGGILQAEHKLFLPSHKRGLIHASI